MSEQTTHADFTLEQLYHSRISGDQELADRSKEALLGILEKLKPLLVFLCGPVKIDYRMWPFLQDTLAVELLQIKSDDLPPTILYLDEVGRTVVVKTTDNRTRVIGVQDLSFAAREIPFSRVIEALSRMVETGQALEQQHRELKESRLEMLRKITEAVEAC